MNNIKIGKTLEFIAVSALLFTFFGFFSVKIWDIDFWWHMAAGKDILLNGVIPSVDPFGIYQADNACGQTVLKSEWLGQVMLYLANKWMGLNGVILLRAGVLTLCLAIIYQRCRLAGVAGFFSFAFTTLAGLAILNFTGERPNLFSFLFMAVIFLLLDEFSRTGKRWLLYGVPLVVLVWSNTHAGVVLGVASFGLYGIFYGYEQYLEKSTWNTTQTRLMAMVVFLSLLIMLLAPSGLSTLECIIEQQSGIIVRDRVSEYGSPITLWRVAVYYWIFVGAAVISLVGLSMSKQYKHAALVLSLGALSVIGYRYIPLFVLAVAPYVASGIAKVMRYVKASSLLVNGILLSATLGFLTYGIKYDRAFQYGVVEHRFPIGAVEYIKNNQIQGRMFNSMNWGGYILWELHGKVQIFIDGRTLDMRRLVPYTHILWVTPEGRQFFDQGEFDLVLVAHGNQFSGERYPLVEYLRNNPQWKIVYQDAVGYLFARR